MKTGYLDRVTLCSACGAPLQVPAGGQAVRCDKCGAENVVAARMDSAIAEQWSEDELRRLAHLSSQPRAFSPEPAVAPLIAGMRLSPAMSQAAFAEWQRARAALRPSDLPAERAFTQLTLLLALQAAENADPVRERGLLESALGSVRDPRQVQMLRASLSLLACRMGDREGAEAWLGACDGRAADLRADSYYRLARALIDTASNQSWRVLTVLGGNDVEVPIVDELSGACGLLRAHAWERLGRVEAAVDLLVHYQFEGDPFGQQLARSFLSIHRSLDLCPVSGPRAEALRLRSLGRRRIAWTKGMVVVSGMALTFLLGAVLTVLFGVGAIVTGSLSASAYSFLLAFVDMALVALFGGLLLGAWRRTRRERAVLAFGQIAPARIVNAKLQSESTALTTFAATVAVYPDHGAPLTLATTIGTSPERYAEYMSGRPFTVRYGAGDILIEPVLR